MKQEKSQRTHNYLQMGPERTQANHEEQGGHTQLVQTLASLVIHNLSEIRLSCFCTCITPPPNFVPKITTIKIAER